MGFWQNMMKRINVINPVKQEHNAFARKVKKMIQQHEPIRGERDFYIAKLNRLERMAVIERMEGRGELSPDLAAERGRLLLNHAVGTIPDAFYFFMCEVNRHYNRGDTADARWLLLMEKFFKYRSVNFKEIMQLENLKKEAVRLNATALEQKVVAVVQELNQEEESFREMVEGLRPENYKNEDRDRDYAKDCQRVAKLIDDKSDLYIDDARARTALLKAYRQYAIGCRHNVTCIEEGIVTVGQYWGNEIEMDTQGEQSVLKSIVQTAQQERAAAESTTAPAKTPVLNQETRGI